MKYKQLTRKERYLISEYKAMGYKIKKMANLLGRHISTIYLELKRNRDQRGFYYSRKAHLYALARRAENGKRAIRIDESR